MKRIVLILFSSAYAIAVNAQSYTIQEPGKLPTYVHSTSSGVTINKPGQLPTTVRTTSDGGATINTPGQLPTYVNGR